MNEEWDGPLSKFESTFESESGRQYVNGVETLLIQIHTKIDWAYIVMIDLITRSFCLRRYV